LRRWVWRLWLFAVMIISGCASAEPRVVYITATFVPRDVTSPDNMGQIEITPFPTFESLSTVQPTVSANNEVTIPKQHVVQTGETLTGIARQYGTTIETLIELNTLENPDVLSVGQVITLPDVPTEQTPSVLLLPDSRFVRGREGARVDVAAIVDSAAGYIRTARDTITDRSADGSSTDNTFDAALIVDRVSREYSVDPRLLLAMLEYRAGWLTQANLMDAQKTNPLISAEASTINRDGLYRQLAWLSNTLNRAYYAYKYDGWRVIEFSDGRRLNIADGLNAASAAVQYALSLNTIYDLWLRDVSAEGFSATYTRLFGNAFEGAPPSSVPNEPLIQPELTLPFVQGQVWFFTGGAHGGWGNGSAWSAVDFAPPDERTDNRLCYTSDSWVTAVADGVIARSENGAVALDLDGDGDESTGWVIFYLHLATEGRVSTGQRVTRGDSIGRPSCEGGFSTATHLHIGRKYNGEWIPTQCFACGDNDPVPPFSMSGWTVVGLRGQEYQGYIVSGGERRVAEQGRISPINRVSW